MKKLFKLIIVLDICLILIYNFDNIIKLIDKITYSDGLPTNYEINANLVLEDEVVNLSDSIYTGDEYSFDDEKYVYYSMLNDKEKSLYKQMYANSIEMEENFKPIVSVSISEVKKVFEAFLYDNPEIFWIDSRYSYKYTQDKKCVQISLLYYFDKDNIEYQKNIFNGKINNIVKLASTYKTDYEKELYVHNYLINTIDYSNNYNYNQSAYSAIITKKAVCAGYSKAFVIIMRKLNINAYYVVGYANTEHAWNIVKINGDYYNVDLTWNDTNKDKHKYFNVSDKFISKTHTRLNLSKKLPKCY